MPSQKIPCKDCDKKKKEIEAGGNYKVVRCDPIPGEDGWCIIEWKSDWE